MWVRQIKDDYPADVPTHYVDLVPNDVLDRGALLGSTVTRVRGWVSVYMGAGNLNGSRLTVGLAVAPPDVTTGGIGAEGAAMTNLDWFYWESLPMINFSTAGETSTQRLELDAKAQRRVRNPGDSVGMYITVVHKGTTPQFQLFSSTSTLVKTR